MKHRLFYAGKAFSNDSEVALTHVLVGQRAEHVDKPPDEVLAKRHKDRSPEEQVAVEQYLFRQTNGWYAIKPLAWAEDAAQAHALQARFPAPDWINHAVVPVSAVVAHA